jgi:Ni/Fe-hydrogenase subunit HybB-like protein
MIEWDLLIVLYPYITGLVAGAFVVSALYHVFNQRKLRPVARFSLLVALAFLIVTPLPLVVHLGRPERALEMFLTPNLVSAMSAFGYIWFFYLLLVIVEIWLIFRPDIVRYASLGQGAKKVIYSILTLGVHDVSEGSLALDRKVIKVLSFVGIPTAFLLHGYVGFIFGAVKANPWWSTPLMPIIFLLSAIVSGIALLTVSYIVITKLRKKPLDYDCLRSLSLWLLGILCINVVVEGLEVFSMFYESEESWEIIARLITERIGFSYFGIQFLAGAVIPLLILGGTEISRITGPAKAVLLSLSSALILIGVFAMRWNVVIGGQLISKSLRGFSNYTPAIWGEGGIIVGSVLMLLPFLLTAIEAYFLPPWQEAPQEESARREFSW